MITRQELNQWQNDQDFQMDMVRLNGSNIKYIKNPSKEVQIESVKKQSNAIQLIKNPCEEAQVASMKHRLNIRLIDDPCTKTVIMATKIPRLIPYLKWKLGEELPYHIAEKAIQHDPRAAHYVDMEKNHKLYELYAEHFDKKGQFRSDNPHHPLTGSSIEFEEDFMKWGRDSEYRKKMVEMSPDNIYRIDNPSELLVNVAVAADGTTIKCVQRPSPELQEIAVNQNIASIKYIKNRDHKTSVMAIKQKWSMIKYVKDPSEEIQMDVVTENWSAIQYIRNPTHKVCLLALRNDDTGEAIRYIDLERYPDLYDANN